MNNELLKLESKELRITSMELVDIINQFREEEFRILKEKGLNKKDKYTELRHDSFMTKIKKELETLKTLGLCADQNILEGSYADKNGQKRPCYTLNRDGMLQMLNSESVIVRAKTINYINKLEQQLNGKANLLLSIYEGGQNAILASKKLTELEVAEAIKPLNDKIEEQTPFVKIAIERLDKGEKISLTDVTKSLNLKKGQISVFLKLNGYLHKSQTEVNEKGKDMFKIYKENGFSCIGILEQGIKFIQDNIDEIRKLPCRMPKNK